MGGSSEPVTTAGTSGTQATAAKPAEWLLMVHMSADAPNLERPLSMDFEELSRPLKEVGKAYADAAIEIVVQVDTATGVSKRFGITAQGPHCLKVFRPERGRSVEQFMTDILGRTDLPEKKALVIWGHASGVGHGLEKPIMVSAPGPASQWSGFVNALGATNFIVYNHTLDQVLSALAQVGDEAARDRATLDILGFDACFMASVELAFQLRGTARHMLAPQAGINLEGWHYDQLVDQILAEPAIEPAALCTNVIAQVGLSHRSPEQLSLLRLADHVDLFRPAVRALGMAIRRAYEDEHREPQMRQWIFDAFNDAAWAGARQFLDLGDLCRQLASRIPDVDVRRAAQWVLHVLSWDPAVSPAFPEEPKSPLSATASTGGCPGWTEEENTRPKPLTPRGPVADQLSMLDVPLSGISIYCPWPRATTSEVRAGARNALVDPDKYRDLQFVKATCWHKVVYDMPGVLQEAERYWIRREVSDRAQAFASDGESSDDPKAPGKSDDPKSPKKMDEPKPAGRGDENGRSSRRTRRPHGGGR